MHLVSVLRNTNAKKKIHWTGLACLGFDDTFVPMGFKDENGEYTGFDIELAKAVGEKLGKEIAFQQ